MKHHHTAIEEEHMYIHGQSSTRINRLNTAAALIDELGKSSVAFDEAETNAFLSLLKAAIVIGHRLGTPKSSAPIQKRATTAGRGPGLRYGNHWSR
jgi:hypothetical protein